MYPFWARHIDFGISLVWINRDAVGRGGLRRRVERVRMGDSGDFDKSFRVWVCQDNDRVFANIFLSMMIEYISDEPLLDIIWAISLPY